MIEADQSKLGFCQFLHGELAEVRANKEAAALDGGKLYVCKVLV